MTSRRDFFTQLAMGVGAITLLPGRVLGDAPRPALTALRPIPTGCLSPNTVVEVPHQFIRLSNYGSAVEYHPQVISSVALNAEHDQHIAALTRALYDTLENIFALPPEMLAREKDDRPQCKLTQCK